MPVHLGLWLESQNDKLKPHYLLAFKQKYFPTTCKTYPFTKTRKDNDFLQNKISEVKFYDVGGVYMPAITGEVEY